MPEIKITSEGLFIDGMISVGTWETPIQNLLAQSTATKSSSVLEIGYGLGMASRAIAALCPAAHWLVERYPEVLPPTGRERNLGLTGIVIAPWQIALPMFRDESFDAVLFEADPLDPGAYDGSVEASLAFIEPVLPEASRILRPGGRLGFIDFSATIVRYAPFERLTHSFAFETTSTSLPTVAPPNCRYAPNPNTHIVLLTKTARA